MRNNSPGTQFDVGEDNNDRFIDPGEHLRIAITRQ